MKKINLALLAALLLTGSSYALYQMAVPIPDLNKPIKNETRRADNNVLMCKESVTLYKTNRSGKNYLVYDITVKGLADNKYTKRIIDYYLLEGNKLTIDSHQDVTTFDNGKSSEQDISFDWPNWHAYMQKKENGQNSGNAQTLDLNERTITSRGMSLYFPVLIDSGKTSDSFRLITPVGQLFTMQVKVLPVENISVEGSVIPCYHLTLKPDLGLISGLAPTLNFWMRKDPPHAFVRYQGPESGPTSPTIIQQIVSN